MNKKQKGLYAICSLGKLLADGQINKDRLG